MSPEKLNFDIAIPSDFENLSGLELFDLLVEMSTTLTMKHDCELLRDSGGDLNETMPLVHQQLLEIFGSNWTQFNDSQIKLLTNGTTDDEDFDGVLDKFHKDLPLHFKTLKTSGFESTKFRDVVRDHIIMVVKRDKFARDQIIKLLKSTMNGQSYLAAGVLISKQVNYWHSHGIKVNNELKHLLKGVLNKNVTYLNEYIIPNYELAGIIKEINDLKADEHMKVALNSVQEAYLYG